MDAQYSGVSEYTLNLISEIFKLDSKNEYRLFYNSAKDIKPRLPKFNYPNVKIIEYKYPNKFLNYFLFNFFNFPRIDKSLGADVFFMPHINFIGLSGKAKNILTIHDLSYLRFPEFFSFRKNFWHRMVNTKKLVKKFDKIIAISENTKNDIIDLLGVPSEKISVIYSGLENIFSARDIERLNQIKIKYSLPDKYILFIGNHEPRKNIACLIQAFNKIKNDSGLARYKLVLAGGKGWKGGQIYKEWEKSKYKNDIMFLGYIDKNDKAAVYNLSSLFVFPSFYEGFGFPPLEAMASGVPVITSFASSLPEIAGNSAVMVDPYNVNDLSIAINKVLSDNVLRNNLIEAGEKKAAIFSWKNAAQSYVDLFESI